MEFKPFEKIHRLSRECIVTEKIDGTNGVIAIQTLPGYLHPNAVDHTDEVFKWGQPPVFSKMTDAGLIIMFAGSRTRWITPEKDNMGFAKWVKANGEELLKLGEGVHYGEWWGQGIQRTYGLKEKRFSLFNVSRWTDDVRPACCHVVPTLYTGMFSTVTIEALVRTLEKWGSIAAPDFMRPEGVVVFHVPSGHLFKKTIENDEKPKGQVNDG